MKTKLVKGPFYPILGSLVIRGLVRWDEVAHQWMGKASNSGSFDAVWVQLGHDAASAEKYLTTHPKPEDW